MNWHYAPGEYPVLQNERLILLIAADPGDLPLADIETMMAGANDLVTVLDYLASFGVSELPPFCVVQFGSPTTLVLRGGIQVELACEDSSTRTLSAEGLLSWQEYLVDEITSMQITVVATPESKQLQLGSQPLSMVSELRFQADYEPEEQVPTPPALEEPPVLSEAAVTNTFDELFGATIYGDIELAAVRTVDGPPENSLEVSASEPLAQSEPRITPEETSATYAFNGSTVQIPAQLCPYGHPNPPQWQHCWQCKSPIQPGPIVPATRPSLGWLEFNDGKRIPLDRNILIGRNPVISRLGAADLPKLVTVESPNQDISRNHLSVLLDGWYILIEDLNTTNGTMVIHTTGTPFGLIAGQPYRAETGSRVQLGDGVEFWVNGVFA